MMERTVPWWRRALKFALSGFRSRVGQFARNAKIEPSAETGAETEIAAGRFEKPKEDTALKHSSPHSEAVAAEIEQAAEVVPSAKGKPAAQPDVVTHSTAEQPAVALAQLAAAEAAAAAEVPAEVKVQPAEIAAAEVVQAEAGGGEQALVVATAEKPVEAEVAVAADEVPAEVEAQPAEVVAEAEAAPEETAAVKAAKEPAAAPTAGAEPTSAPAAETVPAQEIVAQEAALTLPFSTELTAEQKAARVAAALKARGEDAEQSPFSVIVSQVYDGPLDLLLDLIRKQDIDIYDIPIAKITAQFLAYVDQLKASDMDVAGEFIYTAALLIHIKSKMLLPRAPAGPEEAAEDPRRELVERLLEHERYKNAAQMLKEKQMLEAATWTNPGAREFREEAGAESETAPEIAADTVDLVRVFRDILERARNRPIIDVEEDAVTVSQMIQFLARRLTMEDKPVALRRLLSHTRSERALIAMFLALLELVRLQAILLRQDRHFSEIFVKKHTGFDAAMNQGLSHARDDWR